jgi:muramoyltetrapeptide carboxypeptidase
MTTLQNGLAPLPAGSLIAVIAPAGPPRPGQLASVAPLYARHGYRVRLYPGCEQATGYLAGPDATRLADLHAALADDEVAAIHCLRGGYGAMRLLPDIDATLVRRSRKLLVGYSDITALHALWCREGLPSLHAPMPASDFSQPGREGDEAALFALLKQGLQPGQLLPPDPGLDAEGLRHPGRAEGLLVGGNLSLIAALLGTPWAWPAQGSILFLEDVSEELYRVDRLLMQLRLAGVLDAVSGIVLGSFTESESPTALLRELLLPLCQRRGLPLLGGWPAGHGTPNRPLPLGLKLQLDVPAESGGTLRLAGG